jgi:hypothetical protein
VRKPAKPTQKPRPRVGRPCLCCRSDDRVAIDQALIAGETCLDLSRKYAFSHDAIQRHRDNHLPTPIQAEAARQVAEAEALTGADMMTKVAGLLRQAEEILAESRADGDRLSALRSIHEAGEMVMRAAKLTGVVTDNVEINILVAPALQSLTTLVLQALAPYAEARMAVSLALSQITGPAPMMLEHQPS